MFHATFHETELCLIFPVIHKKVIYTLISADIAAHKLSAPPGLEGTKAHIRCHFPVNFRGYLTANIQLLKQSHIKLLLVTIRIHLSIEPFTFFFC